MLRKAQERVAELGLCNVEGLAVMDAEHLSTSRTTRSTSWWRNTSSPRCPIPEATLDEFARVLKPGGEIVLVSRVGAEAGLRRALEQWFAPAAAQARLADGVLLGALCALGGRARTTCA